MNFYICQLNQKDQSLRAGATIEMSKNIRSFKCPAYENETAQEGVQKTFNTQNTLGDSTLAT